MKIQLKYQGMNLTPHFIHHRSEKGEKRRREQNKRSTVSVIWYWHEEISP